MEQHLTTDEVTALAAGTLPEARIDHVAGCDTCAVHLADVGTALASAPVPVMPPEVVARLDRVIAAESQRRTSGEAEREEQVQQAAHAKRLALGTFGDNSPRAESLARKPAKPAQAAREISRARPS